jgi:hypothetical protein
VAIKCVILFQQVTNPTVVTGPVGIQLNVLSAPSIGYNARQHIAGWSEYVMWNTDVVGDLLTALQQGASNLPALLPARAAMLSQGANIIGVRLYQGGAGKGQSFALSYPGNTAYEGDNPQQALLIKAGNATNGATRRFTIRGVPDNEVQGGEFAPDPGYVNAVNNWMRALANFAFRAIDPASPAGPVFNVAPVAIVGPPPQTNGLVTMNQNAQPFLVNQIVTINGALDSNGFRRNFRGTISAVGPQQNQFTLLNWPWGATTGGRVSAKNTAVFPISYSTLNVARLVTRRVGRPFELYRGRRSRRHK